MKKILIYSHLYPNSREPMRGIFVQERVRFLKQFYEIKVVAPIPYFPKIRISERWNKFSSIPDKEILQGVEVYHPRFILFPKRFLRKYVGWGMYFLSKKILKKIYSEWEFDLIHAHFTMYSGQAVNYFYKENKIPYVITEHYGKTNFDLSKNSIYRNIYKEVFFNAKRIIVVSERLKSELKNNFPYLKNIRLISNGVDISKFRFVEKKIDKQTPRLISIGNLLYTKGLQYLIDAIKILKEDGINCILTIIGEGKYRKELETMIAKYSLQKNVILTGFIKNNEINKYFEDSDIYVHPSLFESFGVVVIEAMAAGMPVIVTKSGGPEYFVPDEFGLKIEKGNSDVLASAIKKMIVNYELYNRKEIRNFVEENFSYEKIAKKISGVYEEIIS